MKRLNDFLLIFVFILFMFDGCSQTTPTSGYVYNRCKNIKKPSWLNDDFVGISRITASGDKTEQKFIAIQRAISLLLVTKGILQGVSLVSVKKDLNKINQKEFYNKKFKENSSIKIKFKYIDYDIKVVNMWEDPCTKEIYVRIKEK